MIAGEEHSSLQVENIFKEMICNSALPQPLTTETKLDL
jgi:hypothetical protein